MGIMETVNHLQTIHKALNDLKKRQQDLSRISPLKTRVTRSRLKK